MLPFFPSPYPDELLYGICARYHQRSGHSSVGYSLRDLFGNRQTVVSIDLPTNLRFISGNLSSNTLQTVERLIDSHTLLPLYRPFLPKRRVSKIQNRMSGETLGGNIHMTVGATASGVASVSFLRYCPSCLREDERDHGEPYWHRSHQVAGVGFCHSHQEWLLDSTVAVSRIGCRHGLIPLSGNILTGQAPSREPGNLAHHSWLSAAAHWLLNVKPPLSPPGLERIRRRYLSYLRRMGLASAFGRVDCRNLVDRFLAFYGEEFLAQSGCALTLDGGDYWLFSLLRKPRKTGHPLRHLLFIRFLGCEPEEFFSEEPGLRPPFGRGPWPCLNPAATHFQQPVVSTCSLRRRPGPGVPVGTFTCSCGFSFERSGPDQCREDRFRIGRMVSFGTVWEGTLLRLMVKERKGLREVARQLRVDPKTIRRHLAALMVRPDQKIPVSQAQKEDLRDLRRKSWSRACAANPNAGVKGVRYIAGADYTWLYRHDWEWLRSHLPHHKTRPPPMKRVDWNERDNLLAARVQAVTAELRERTGRPARVTASAIGRNLGVSAMFSKPLERLPHTQGVLSAVVESREDFAIRRLRLAAEKLRLKGELIKEWKLVRVAGLRPGYPDSVARELECLLLTGPP